MENVDKFIENLMNEPSFNHKLKELIKTQVELACGKINKDEVDLRFSALERNAYLYSGWDYFKYPIADLSFGYGDNNNWQYNK